MSTTQGGPVAPRAGWSGDGNRRGRARPLRTAGVLAVLAGATVAGVALPRVAPGATPTVQIVTAPTSGTVLATATGLPLYTLGTDHDGLSTCTDSCLQVWPPLTVPAGTAPTAGAGVPGQLGDVTQADGRHQVTFDGSPLYTFVGDQPATVTGNGVAGFEVVHVTPTAATTTTTTTTTTTVPGATSAPTTTVAPAAGATTVPSTAAGSPDTPGPATAATGASTGTAVPIVGAAGTATPPTLAVTGTGDGTRQLAVVGAALALSGGLGLLVVGRVTRRAVPARRTR